jgi:hypothetical protein
MAVLVYLMRSLVAFSPCSACCPIDDLCLAIFALPFLMLHVTACFACFAQKLVTYLASAYVNVSLMLRILVCLGHQLCCRWQQTHALMSL